MLPINVMYDSGLDEIEEAAVIAALQDISAMVPELTINCFGSSSWSMGSYSSADWYVRNTGMVRGIEGGLQLNADHLIDLIAHEPWQVTNPHIDIMITSHDITAFDDKKQLRFVFGLASGRITVQSIARFRGCSDVNRFLAVETVIWHELGHILGMAADLNRSNTVESLGPHCTNQACVMQQGLSVSEWLEHAWDAYRAGRIYCPQCLADAFVLAP